MISKRSLVKKMSALAGVALLALILAGCAGTPKAGGSSPTAEDNPALQVEWSADADCGVCHIDEESSYTNAACLASLHKDISCIDCHENETDIKALHEGKTASDKMPKKLKQTNLSEDACLSCHFETKEELAANTPDIADALDDNGTALNPHEALILPQHVESGNDMTCEDCHKMHDEKTAEQAMDLACASCHHAGVFECYTCHEE